ncbi:DNA-methyltransferase [Mycoplasma sp. P36-A1]|uniref:DNA-methyltransferase n=1 Tax=Mycoplasma sp. P36-A1 TaxID=3252900 RepID=UPI003C2BF41B
MENANKQRKIKCELYHDSFQNYKRYNIPKAQLVIADIPYNLGNNAYASNPSWYIGGDNKNGESKKANSQFFPSDKNFNLVEYMHFCQKLLIKEPKEKGKAPAMIIFCAFQQMHMLIEIGKRYGFKNAYPLFFIKKTSGQALKANQKILGATEYAVVLYRDKLPKFNNAWQQEETGKKMILNWFEFKRDSVKEVPKIHPTQKPVNLLEKLIKTFTDEGDVVIDPVAGSGTTLLATKKTKRNSFGFEVLRDIYKKSKDELLSIEFEEQQKLF